MEIFQFAKCNKLPEAKPLSLFDTPKIIGFNKVSRLHQCPSRRSYPNRILLGMTSFSRRILLSRGCHFQDVGSFRQPKQHPSRHICDTRRGGNWRFHGLQYLVISTLPAVGDPACRPTYYLRFVFFFFNTHLW